MDLLNNLFSAVLERQIWHEIYFQKLVLKEKFDFSHVILTNFSLFLFHFLGDRDEIRGDKDLDAKKDASKDEPMDVDDVKSEDKKESATVEASS